MNKNRFEALEKFFDKHSERARQELLSFAPLAYLEVRDIIPDRFYLEYWPNGWQHGAPEKYEGTWEQVTDELLKLTDDTKIQLFYGNCSEYLAVRQLYLPRRIETYRGVQVHERDPEHVEKLRAGLLSEFPWIADMRPELIETLKMLPESVIVNVGWLRENVFEERE